MHAPVNAFATLPSSSLESVSGKSAAQGGQQGENARFVIWFFIKVTHNDPIMVVNLVRLPKQTQRFNEDLGFMRGRIDIDDPNTLNPNRLNLDPKMTNRFSKMVFDRFMDKEGNPTQLSHSSQIARDVKTLISLQ